VRRLVAFGASAVIGPLPTEALVIAPAVGAAATAQRAFENDSVAFFNFVNLGSIAPKLFNARQDFVTENDRVGDLQFAMEILNVRPTNATHFDL